VLSRYFLHLPRPFFYICRAPPYWGVCRIYILSDLTTAEFLISPLYGFHPKQEIIQSIEMVRIMSHVLHLFFRLMCCIYTYIHICTSNSHYTVFTSIAQDLQGWRPGKGQGRLTARPAGCRLQHSQKKAAHRGDAPHPDVDPDFPLFLSARLECIAPKI